MELLKVEIGNTFTVAGMEFIKFADANGTVDGLTSVSPNMTLIPDTEGIIIDCDYNVDTKLYIDNGLAKIKAELSAAILNT